MPRNFARLLPLVLVAFPLCGVQSSFAATTSRVASNGFAGEPASSIVAAARAAMIGAKSVQGTGSLEQAISEMGGKVIIRESAFAGVSTGSQEIQFSYPPKRSGAALPTGITIYLSGAVYVKGNKPFLVDFIDLPANTAATLANKWVRVPATAAIYKSASADMTMSSLVTDLFHSTNYRKGPTRVLSGTRTIEIEYQNTGFDDGPATSYIAVNGKHLPVKTTISGIPISLSGWGSIPKVTAPASSTVLPGS